MSELRLPTCIPLQIDRLPDRTQAHGAMPIVGTLKEKKKKENQQASQNMGGLEAETHNGENKILGVPLVMMKVVHPVVHVRHACY